VQLTADGELVVIHDDTLERTSNVTTAFPDREPWRVREFTLQEIRTLDFGSWYNESDPFGQIAAGAVRDADQRSFVGTDAPTLHETLVWTRDAHWQVNVELKSLHGGAGEDDFVERVVGMIAELDMIDEVIISSFDHPYLTRVRRADPRIRIAALTGEPLEDAAGYVRGLRADAYNPGIEVTDEAEIAAVRAAGIEVNVYTVNEEADMRRLARAGASGIITDFPQRLGPLLEEMGGA
jgi:glycerophosphoryl diester phosphodiesterase